MRRKKEKGLRLFNIITWCMICLMIYYIGAKLTSLVITGDTRQVIIIETRQYLLKKVKTIVCNEILTSDEYLTEDRLIQLTKLQHNRKKITKEEEEIDKFVVSLGNYGESIEDRFKEIKNNINNKINTNVSANENNNNDNNYKNDSNDYNNNIKYKTNIDIENAKEKLLAYKENGNKANIAIINKIKKTNDVNYMLNKLYIIDGKTSIDKKQFQPKKLLNINNKIKKDKTKPQILIYHTHSTEAYADSRKGVREDTVVGVGDYLSEILVRDYGYNVIHVSTPFDISNGKWNRNAYDAAYPKIKNIIDKNPSIEIVIDLHRDSGKKKEITTINGVKVAKVMFFNGVSRSVVGSRSELSNPNLVNNLSFSLAMKLQSMSMYKDFTKKIYIKGYRYNMHLAKKYTLIEVGNNKNTVAEAKNAMALYAKILDRVLD